MAQQFYDDLPYPAAMQQDERRAKPRLRCKGIAELIVFPLVKKMPGTLLDLSVNGCCIDTEAPLPPIENPAVEVVLTVSGFKLRLAGVVRNVRRDHRAGIEFIDVTKRKADQIQELVKDLLARNFTAYRRPERPRNAAFARKMS